MHVCMHLNVYSISRHVYVGSKQWHNASSVSGIM